MSLIERKKQATLAELRVFSCALFPLFALLVGWLLFSRFGSPIPAGVLLGLAVVLASLGIVYPPAVKPVFLLWMWLAYPVGWLVSHLFMGMIYYGILTPVGWGMQLLGRDPMERSFDCQAKTYWRARGESPAGERYFRQF